MNLSEEEKEELTDFLIEREECIMDLDDEELKATKKLNGVAKKNKKFEIKIGGKENGQRIYNAIKLLNYIDSLSLHKIYGIQRLSKGITVLTKDEVIQKQKIKDKIEELKYRADGIARTYQYADSQEDLQEKKDKVIELRTKAEGLQELLQEEDK